MRKGESSLLLAVLPLLASLLAFVAVLLGILGF